MIFEIEDSRHIYTVHSVCGRASEVYCRSKNNGAIGTPVEVADLPFLVQAEIEATINRNLDGCPSDLWSR